MSLLAGVALRQFQKKYFGSLKSLGFEWRRMKSSHPHHSHLDKTQYARFLAEEDVARKRRLQRGNPQIRWLLFLLTVLPILAFILACLR